MRPDHVREPDPEPGAVSGPPAPGSAGLVVRFDERAASAADVPPLAWIPATVARRVAFASATTTLGVAGGISLGLAHVEGRLLTMIALGEVAPHAPVVVCAGPEAEVVAVAVSEVAASGRFDDAEGGAVLAVGERVPLLDVSAITSRLEAALWIADPAPDRASRAPRRVR